jgi:hypothetical protein
LTDNNAVNKSLFGTVAVRDALAALSAQVATKAA